MSGEVLQARSHPVVCLSAGLLRPKKRDTGIARRHLYLNYGLLGLATILRTRGWETVLVHGEFDEPSDTVARLFAAGHLPSPHPILLSIPSSFALPWARAASRKIKERDPAARIVVGGRWVVADDEDWVRGQLPDADLIVRGKAEGRVHDLVDPYRWPRIPLVDDGSWSPAMLAYDIVEGYRRYQPSIEASRGCGMGCSFCAEASEPLTKLKDPDLLAVEIDHCVGLYGPEELHPYLEASFFRPNRGWCARFAEVMRASRIEIAWRTETRVDVLSPGHVESLAAAGLRVLDLGLESASPKQLVTMGKTTTPDTYLRRAHDLLRACRDVGVQVKINVLLHPGETIGSLEQTYEWLEQHRDCIKGVSVGPTIVFRYGAQTQEYLASLAALGARPVDPAALDRDGYSHLHLSPELPHEAAVEASLALSRTLMTARDYFDLKSFSYLPRGTSWDDFLSWARESDPSSLPFDLPPPPSYGGA